MNSNKDSNKDSNKFFFFLFFDLREDSKKMVLRRLKRLLNRAFKKEVKMVLRGGLGSFTQAIVLRGDLRLSKAQCVDFGSHASLHAFQQLIKKGKAGEAIAFAWDETGCKKIVLRARNLRELLKCKQRAQAAGLAYYLIIDEKLGETVLAIGPWYENDLRELTRGLNPLQ